MHFNVKICHSLYVPRILRQQTSRVWYLTLRKVDFFTFFFPSRFAKSEIIYGRSCLSFCLFYSILYLRKSGSWWCFGLHKTRGISRLAEWLLASQEGVSEWVSECQSVSQLIFSVSTRSYRAVVFSLQQRFVNSASYSRGNDTELRDAFH